MTPTPKMFHCKKYNVSMFAKNADTVCLKRFKAATKPREELVLNEEGAILKAIQFAHCLDCRRGKRLGKENL